MNRLLCGLIIAGMWLGVCTPSPAIAAPSVYLEELTWPEVKDLIKKGTVTILIPTGGTEQNGPHIALGKHNRIVQHTAGEIARQLGNALVAPVIAYVPEGRIEPPEGHMLFPGTLSLREEIYEGVLEDAARSLKQAGFKTICFIGDSGGNQDGQKAVAQKLNKVWQGEGVHVLHVNAYYAPPAADSWAARHKRGSADAAAHAGFMDTSEMLAVQPQGVRGQEIRAYHPAGMMTTGVAGDPRGAKMAYGKQLLKFKIDAAVSEIRRHQRR